MDRPSYVEFGGLASAPGPLACDDTTLYVFALGADRSRLEALCRRVFAEPTGGAVDLRPLGDHVIVTFGVVGAIRPGLEPWHSMGAVREPQVGYWIPVARVHDDGDGDAVAQDFGMFCAAMMLDNPISLLSGREDYGYPKTMGWSTMPAGEDLRAPFTLEVFGMDFGDRAAPARRPLMELTPVGDALSDAELAVGDMLSVGRWIKDLLFGDDDVDLGLRFALAFAEDLRAHRVDQVFLKQVRATGDGRRADLQQVVVAPAITRNVRARQLHHDYDLTLHHLDSHPLHDELGLADQRVTLACRLDFDFVIEAGRVVWERR
jgi:hypothetical protein